MTNLPAAIIAKKRDAKSLSEAEIRCFVEGFVEGSVADYQMSAFAMAVLLRGMTFDETAALTLAMLASGERLPRPSDGPPRVDKHSTGGLGDKVSLFLAPLLACQGVHVPMVSGRGLGLSGGTLDKLEAIPGFQCHLSDHHARHQLDEIGCFIVGASERIAPADRRFYALRDVTGTVESIPLITASILSKKLAASLDALVMDVKAGSAAFMKTLDEARSLARSIVLTAQRAGLPTTALITDMDQPLGRAIGNAIEVNETLECLDGAGPKEVIELTLALASELLVRIGSFTDAERARQSLCRSMAAGEVRERFERMIAMQGGQLLGALPLAPSHTIESDIDGWVERIDCETIGRCVVEMGGGRRQTGDSVDPSVGISLRVRIGDSVRRGQPILEVHAKRDWERHAAALATAIEYSDTRVEPRPLILDRVDADSWGSKP